jgi:hypothetical protein
MLAVVSSIFLSNNGEIFAALAVDNNDRIGVPKIYKHDNYTCFSDYKYSFHHNLDIPHSRLKK